MILVHCDIVLEFRGLLGMASRVDFTEKVHYEQYIFSGKSQS